MKRFLCLCSLIAISVLCSASSSLAQCGPPMIGSTAAGLEAFPEIEEDRAVVQYNDNCQQERWTKIWLLEEGKRPVLLQQDSYDTDGWRTLEITGLTVNSDYCVAVETPPYSLPLWVSSCFKTVYAPRVYELDNANKPLCGNPTTPTGWRLEEHIYLSEKAAEELGIDPSLVSNSGPSPQVRILIDESKVAATYHPSAIYTVAGICTDTMDKPNRFWVWETTKLFANQPPALPVRAKIVQAIAPSSTFDGMSLHHFADPNPGSKEFTEAIESAQNDNEVLVMAPHGGNIETGTSQQIPFFRSALTQNNIDSSYWDVSGKWGNNETHERWHITSTAIHSPSFPGLDALLGVHGQFDTAVSFHGYRKSGNEAHHGLIVGGGTSTANKCHVVQMIETLADAEGRGGEIAYYIAAVNSNNDINLPSTNPAVDIQTAFGGTVDDYRGTDSDNIVNRVSGGNGIQLEQTKMLRDEDNCGTGCLKDLVAAGAALAVKDITNGTVPGNACQF